MKCAVVREFNTSPQYGDMEPPVAAPGEIVVKVRAAALSQLARAQAAGGHYAGGTSLPVIPGIDGVGMLSNGERVYFAFPRAPLGSMAELTAVPAGNCVRVPDEIDDATAAAISNPGMSSWAALIERAHFRPGEKVLINGATGASGRLAIQVARHLQAGMIIATCRNAQSVAGLERLGADIVVPLDPPEKELIASFSELQRRHHIDIVLDYLWGKPAECLLTSFGGRGASDAEPRVRYIQIGSVAGTTINFPGGILRGSGIELVGSGLGSLSHLALVRSVSGVLGAAANGVLSVSALTYPLGEVTSRWNKPSTARVVFTL